MRKLERGNAPNFLTDELQNDLGITYQKNREEKGKKHKFDYWHEIEIEGNITLYQGVLSELKNLSANHCFYCDHFPPRLGDETIDHFRPKSKPEFYSEVCRWDNLYLACNHCQQAKKAKHSELILRPDEIIYKFWSFFDYKYLTDTILPNPGKDELSQLRATKTIEIFDFNHISHRIKRRDYRLLFENDLYDKFEDLAYRFLFD